MKKYLNLIVVLVLVSCTDQLVFDGVSGELAEQNPVCEVASLVEKARWGDGQAYLKLADCYREGIGVKADFVNMMSMASLSEDYGGILNLEDYLKKLPDDNETKMIINAINKHEQKQPDISSELVNKLEAKGSIEALTLKGILSVDRGDITEGKHLIELAADRGSSFAQLLLCIPDWKGTFKPDVNRLETLSDKLPLVNKILGDIYSGRDGEYGVKDETRAAYYYLKADEKACLGINGARWLLGYHQRGGNLKLSEKDIERLHVLAGMSPITEEIVTHNDPKLENAITELLLEDMHEHWMWSKAMIYVVETKTGKIKANLSYERNGEMLVPYIDTYDQEQSEMETGSTYLALLSSGKVTPEHVFDTDSGIYGEVRDHNWRRGGYQQISLERALEVRSQVAFTMAKELVYGDNMTVYNKQINSYLAGNPNSAIGILSFYNAVANNGKMVELALEGKDGIVLQEQIAEPAHINALQKGLQQCVSQGLMRKAGRAYVSVSACGRTFITQGNHRRMELCGYFPSDEPQYTIMVILEKDGLPACAGGMCGPLFALTVDLLVEMYQLQPMLTRQQEEVDEIIEIVDTVDVAN